MVGSAPDPVVPVSLPKDCQVICVNSSGWSANKLGLPKPSLTVMGAFKLTVHRAADCRAALDGLSTDHLLLTNSQSEIPREALPGKLRELGYRFDSFSLIEPEKRTEIIQVTTGNEELDVVDPTNKDATKVSNGMFAVCCACALGSPVVILAGFSFSKDGHAYSDGGRKRRLVQADERVLSSLGESGFNIRTGSEAFAQEAGIPVL